MKRFIRWTGLCETMALTLIVWLCTLPLVGLIIVPLFGSKAAMLTAGALLLALIPVCWAMCGYRVETSKEIQH